MRVRSGGPALPVVPGVTGYSITGGLLPMAQHRRPRRGGFALIDAMIAIIVVSVGLFGIAHLNSVLLGSTGLGKTRSEALQFAEDKIEECRVKHVNEPAAWRCTSGSDTKTGTNATFAREWDITAGSSGNPDTLEVEVDWPGSEAAVNLSTQLARYVLGNGAAIGSEDCPLPCAANQNAPKPSGTAARPGNNENLPPVPVGAIPGVDGAVVFESGGKLYLYDTATGKYLLVNATTEPFSTISGNVYISWGTKINNKSGNQLTLALVKENVALLGSAGAACVQYGYNGNTDLVGYPASGTKYFSMYSYRCYMGAGWFGNIGISILKGGQHICLGDPQVTQSAAPTSSHPILSVIRLYRGLVSIGGITNPVGIGKTTPTSSYTPKNYGSNVTGEKGHHFLITSISGKVDPIQDCRANESFPSASSNPFTTITAQQLGNFGSLFCFTASCNAEELAQALVTNFTLVLQKTVDTPEITAPTNCTLTSSNDTTLQYACEISWAGWSGLTWNGNLDFTTAAALSLVEVGDDNIELADPPIKVDTVDPNKQWLEVVVLPKESNDFTIIISAALAQ